MVATDLNALVQIQDAEALRQGREPFWTKRFRLGVDHKGNECEAELRAYKLLANKEGQDIRLEKGGLSNGKVVQVQLIHLKASDLKAILMLHGELTDGR